MKFRTEIYRRTDPTVTVPVVVSYKRMLHVGMPTTSFDFAIQVFTDRDGDGVADAPSELSSVDIKKTFTATPDQFAAVDARMTGTGNLMQALRNFCKTKVTEHNESVVPGAGALTTFTDLDTD